MSAVGGRSRHSADARVTERYAGRKTVWRRAAAKSAAQKKAGDESESPGERAIPAPLTLGAVISQQWIHVQPPRVPQRHLLTSDRAQR